MIYTRPSTRGELCDLLREGVSCEVATSTAEMTGIMLYYWLGVENYKTRPSENSGWTVFEAIK